MTSASFRQKAAENGQMPLFVPETTWVAPATLPQIAGRGIKRIALDVETKDPDLRTKGIGIRRGGSHIVGIALAADERRWYFPIRHQGAGNLDPEVVLAWAREELNRYDGEVVGANLGYDLDFLMEEGIDLPLVRTYHDTQVLEPLIDENRLRFGLDALAKDYLGETKKEDKLREIGAAYGFTTEQALKSNLWRLPASAVGEYAEGDVDLPLRLVDLQMKTIEAEGLSRIYEIERKLIPILVRMRRRGVRIDVPGAEHLREHLVAKRSEWVTHLKRLAGPKAELMEPESLVKALADRGIHVPLTEKTNKPSITKPFLEAYVKDELVKVILNGRKVNTLITTFMDGQILGQLVGDRLYPTWNQLKGDDEGTIARFSCSYPNLQFIPSRDSDWQEEELAMLVRKVFLPDGDDEWQRDDYSQIEYRLLVHFARGRKAEAARDLYRKEPKTSFHKMAMDMLGVDKEDKNKYKKIKIVNFAKVYGAQPPKLASMMACDVEEAREFVDEYDDKFPFVKDTMDAATGWAQKRGFVVTVLDRRRRYPFWGGKGHKKESGAPVFRNYEEAVAHYGGAHRVERIGCFTALNGKMQGSSADITKKAMVDADEAGLTEVLGPLLITVHDELGTSVPRTRQGDEAARELTRVMERAVELKVPVVVESERGPSWGDCK